VGDRVGNATAAGSIGERADGIVVGRRVVGFIGVVESNNRGTAVGKTAAIVAGAPVSADEGSNAGEGKDGGSVISIVGGRIIVGSAAKVGKDSIGGVSSDVEETGMGAARVPGGGIVGGDPVLGDTGWGTNDGEALADIPV
jgi:hypothetical protein